MEESLNEAFYKLTEIEDLLEKVAQKSRVNMSVEVELLFIRERIKEIRMYLDDVRI